MIGWKPIPFIFVHIPKCAGTSIEKVLIRQATTHNDFRDFGQGERNRFWLPGTKMLQHSKLRRYQDRFSLHKYFKFAFVRNPWDRAVSQIGYLRRKIGETLFPGNDFKEHVRIYCDLKKNVLGHDLGACQYDYLLTHSGNFGVDFVGRFESLTQDFMKVCDIMGIHSNVTLPHIFNSMRTSHYSVYFDDESAGWIQKRFARDIDHFSYSFERLDVSHFSPIDIR